MTTYTPQSFLKDYLRFNADAVKTKGIPAKNGLLKGTFTEVSLQQFVDEVNSKLKSGISFPLGIGIDQSRNVGGIFQAEGSQPFQLGGGHVMLVVGPIKKPIDAKNDKDYIIVKNSWGADIKTTTSDGLYMIEIGYLKKQLEAQNSLPILYISPEKAGQGPQK